MSSLLPLRSDPSTGDADPRVVDLEGEDADEVFSALSSSTARDIVAALHEEPHTQSEIATVLDTTVQNVRYHLDNLEDAGLVEVVDTWYSSRGNEMKVYAPADAALIVSGDESEASRLRRALSRLVGGVAVVGLAALVVQSLFAPGTLFGGFGGRGDGGDAAGGPGAESFDDPTTAEVVKKTVTEANAGDGAAGANNTTEAVTTTVSNADPTTAADAAAGLPPGLLFFLGGVSVLVVVVAVAYWNGR